MYFLLHVYYIMMRMTQASLCCCILWDIKAGLDDFVWFGIKACFASDMLGKSDLQAAWFSISAWRHHADDGPVSFGFTPVIASDRWREAKWIRATFCLLQLTQTSVLRSFKNQEIRRCPVKPSCLCSWASGELSHGADGVKERMWVERGATVSKISMREMLPSFGAHKRE